MSQKDYYEVLGVAKNASEADIKKAFRRKAMKLHPDRNPDDKTAEAKFKEAKAAHDVLTDSQKRAAYDQFGHAGVNQGGQGGPGGAGMGGFNFGDVFGDMFGDIFGGGGGRGGAARGSDLRYGMNISLEEAVAGMTKEISIPNLVNCGECKGSGAKKGTKPVTCTDCQGHGQVRMQQGFFSVQQTCPTCRGQGKITKEHCGSCRGQGRVQKKKTLSVKIPPGVDNGDRIRLANEGEAGAGGGPAGDLYIEISVKRHPIFTRNDNDLTCEVPISFVTASIGGEVEVPTLGGRVKLKISAETQTGKVYRLRGKGVKSVRSSSVGDLMCHVVIETPVNLSKEQKKLLHDLEESMSSDKVNHSPKSTSWFDNVKKFFDDLRS